MHSLTICTIPFLSAALPKAFSASGCIIFVKPVGQMNSGNLVGTPNIELEGSTSATSLSTRGRNQILCSMEMFASRVQQSVEAVEVKA